MLIMSKNLLPFLVILAFSSCKSKAHQQYSGNSVMNCSESDETGPSPAFLYSCNDERPTCKALLMFRTQPPYDSVSSIANLTSSDPQELARLNNVTSSEVLPPDSAVFVPATCSCLGKYYQANASYVYESSDDTYLTIANQTYQGLTSCNALKRENPYGEFELLPSMNLRVPLRCACPSEEQISSGTEFLLTFLITWHDSVASISEKLNVSAKSVAAANGFAVEDPDIYPFTTILIPLKAEPEASKLRGSFSTSFQYEAVPHTKSFRWLSEGVGAGAALAVFCFLALLGFLHFRKVSAAGVSSREMKDRLPEHFLDKVVGIGGSLKIYKYDELDAATDSFSLQRRLSESIYRGILHGKRVAVKKTSTDVSKEMKILGNLNHFNLINLYGVCEHHEVFYLVYEYMEEGSLKNWLCGETSSFAHSWHHRFLIALDVANGLDYLHNFTSPAYVHKDINSYNILLNHQLRAKITNFSLARENGKSHSWSAFGEKGYMAPEYAKAGEVSPKIDVYAFGVVLLELITGREAVLVQDGEEALLSQVVISVVDGTDTTADVNDLVDPRLQVKHPLGFAIDQSELALRLLKLSVACLAPQPTRRLSMDEVVKALIKIQPDIYNPQSFSIE
ncbi:protein LYK5-like [Salvia miltiorrhiza]|uniref:protein LYK5-like n=1 Tax=Salvia miltiorrhiza TaxID=226208 RepID=UPI0025AC29A8|nr:protein LYK5-like [Salvia miltiorrhiza]